MPARARHFEPFLHLVDVTPESALVAWGGFFLEERNGGWLVVDDDELAARRSGGTIGAGSAPYGEAVVEVLDPDGRVVATASTGERNHVEVTGLRPDTAYRYRVAVDGEPWAAAERWDWVLDGGPGEPRPSGRRYDMRFRTHPAPDAAVPVVLLAFGDYGVGITNGEAGRRQAAVSRTLEHLAASHPVRGLVSLGDNIYHGEDDELEQSGDEDDDWYFTFYEPYRYLIDHLPLYPAAGNHDGADEEANDDRAQLADNFHLEARFGDGHEGPGLFYRVGIGALLELLCVDTSAEDGRRHFQDDRRRAWLDDALPPGGADGPWRLPFCHHPAACAGPHHPGMPEQVEELLPRYERAGVRLLLSGHEHNFQVGRAGGVVQVVSGAAGKLQEDPPTRWDEGGTVTWAAAPHCLLVEVGPEEVVVTPYGGVAPGEDPVPLAVRAPDGSPADPRVVIRR